MSTRVSLGRIDYPFRVVGETPTTVEPGAAGATRKVPARQYELKVPFLSIDRKAKVGKARLFLPRRTREPMPLIVSMHYEMSPEAAAEYLAQGWVVMTPREGLNPFGDSINFNLTLVQAGRALPFIDGKRIVLQGTSAGGYVALMAASELFPITAVVPQVPGVNLAYNVAYLEKNMGPAQCGKKDEQGNDALAVPVLCSVAGLLAEAGRILGHPDKSGSNWIANSPVGVLELITCPVQALFSTADAVGPINPVGAGLAYPMPDSFPKKFSFEMDHLLKDAAARITLLEALGQRRARVFRRKVPQNLPVIWEVTEQQQAGAPPYRMPVPSSATARFSICIVDEGPPDPRIGHLKHFFDVSHLEFIKHWMNKRSPVRENQLTGAKLRVLMRRFRGENFEGVMHYRGNPRLASPMNRRNRPGKERLDVILGLRAYCQMGSPYRSRLTRLYARLPSDLRALDVHKGRFAARFQEDVMGGLAFHEAVLHYRWGDKRKAAEVSAALLGSQQHAVYAACLPERITGRKSAR